jgi:hypothetical protein
MDVALQMAMIQRISDGMSEGEALREWGGFLASCKAQDDRHERDGRVSAARLFPDLWTQARACAAGIKLGHMTV